MNVAVCRLLKRLAAMLFIMAAIALPTSALAEDCDDTSMSGVGGLCVESPMENAGGVSRTIFNAGKNQEAALSFFGSLHDAWLVPAFAISGGVLGIFILIALARAAFGAPANQVFPAIIGGIAYVSIAMWPVDANLVSSRMADDQSAALGAVLIYGAADLAETYIKTNTRHWADAQTGGGSIIPAELALRLNPPSVRGLSDSPSVPAILNDYQSKCRVRTQADARDKLTKDEENDFLELSDFDKQNVGLLGYGTLGRDPIDYAGEVATWSIPVGLARLTNSSSLSPHAGAMDASRLRARSVLRRIDNGGKYSPFNDDASPYKIPSEAFWRRYIQEVDQKGKPPGSVVPEKHEYMTAGEIAAALGVPEYALKHPTEKQMLDGLPTGPFSASSIDPYGAYAYNCDQMFGLAHIATGNYGRAYRDVFTIEAESTLRGGRGAAVAGVLSQHQVMIDAFDMMEKAYDNGTNLVRENSAISGDADARQDDQGVLKKAYNLFMRIGGASASDPKPSTALPSIFARIWTWYKDFQVDYWIIGVVGIFSILIGLWFALFPILIPLSFISSRPWEMLFKQMVGVFFLKVSLGVMYIIVLVGNLLAITITQAKALEPLNGMGHIDDLAPLIIVASIGIPFLALATLGITGWLLLGSMRGISQISDKFFGAGQVLGGYAAMANVAAAPFGGAGKIAGAALSRASGGGGGGPGGLPPKAPSGGGGPGGPIPGQQGPTALLPPPPSAPPSSGGSGATPRPGSRSTASATGERGGSSGGSRPSATFENPPQSAFPDLGGKRPRDVTPN